MIDVVRVPAWEQYRWLRHGFSTRGEGVSTAYGELSLNLGWTREDDAAAVGRNRESFLEAVTGTAGSVAVTVRQIHTTEIHAVCDAAMVVSTTEGRATLEGDGLSTNLPGIFPGIQTADCVPVILVDPVRRAVSVLHAGWRGTAAAMAAHGVAHMADTYGSRPEELLAAIGPSIGPCCYAVGEEVRRAFEGMFAYGSEFFLGDRLDLWQANRRQLLGAGLNPSNVYTVGECTGCGLTASGQRKYFSYRIDQGVTGRMMSVAGVLAIA